MNVSERIDGLRRRPQSTATAPWDVAPRQLSRRWWLIPLATYAITRLINAVMMQLASSRQMSVEQFRASGGVHFTTTAGSAPPGFLSVATGWDGQWYWEIASNGYPSTLPTSQGGQVTENPWAFFPLYPMTVRLVMGLTRLTFPVAAVLVSLVCGAVAMLLLHRLVARRHGPLAGNLAVLGVTTYVCAPVFQIAYSEGMAFMLVLAVLWTVLLRRYVWSCVLIMLLGLTRGVTGAIVLALALYAVHMWRARQLSRRDAVWFAALSGWSVLVAAAWVLIAAVTTGTPDAYRLTQAAWLHNVTITPVLDFIARNSDVPGGRVGSFILAVAWTVLLVWLVTWRQAEPLLRAWSAAYVLYLLTLLDWLWSNLRYFILTPPVLWPLVSPLSNGQDDKRQRIAVAGVLAVIGVGLQWWYIRYCVVLSPELAQVP